MQYYCDACHCITTDIRVEDIKVSEDRKEKNKIHQEFCKKQAREWQEKKDKYKIELAYWENLPDKIKKDVSKPQDPLWWFYPCESLYMPEFYIQCPTCNGQHFFFKPEDIKQVEIPK